MRGDKTLANDPNRLFTPVNLTSWIKKNLPLMKPPVSNRCIWSDERETMIFVSHGPNTRNDFHVNATEEFFFQIKGDIAVRVRPLDGRKPFDVVVREGDVYLLPAHVPHRPQRPPNTLGLVVELKRPPGAQDKLQWYCDKCENLVYEAAWELKHIDQDLAILMERFWGGDESIRTCQRCGTVIQRAKAYTMPVALQARSAAKVLTPAAKPDVKPAPSNNGVATPAPATSPAAKPRVLAKKIAAKPAKAAKPSKSASKPAKKSAKGAKKRR
jgi:3-hydroxyanthranilate 3,4-dioxygenase